MNAQYVCNKFFSGTQGWHHQFIMVFFSREPWHSLRILYAATSVSITNWSKLACEIPACPYMHSFPAAWPLLHWAFLNSLRTMLYPVGKGEMEHRKDNINNLVYAKLSHSWPFKIALYLMQIFYFYSVPNFIFPSNCFRKNDLSFLLILDFVKESTNISLINVTYWDYCTSDKCFIIFLWNLQI